MIKFNWDGFNCMGFGFNMLDRDTCGQHGRDHKWVLWVGPFSVRCRRSHNGRYASWGTDGSYRWFWRAALQDAIFAFKQRYKKAAKENKVKV